MTFPASFSGLPVMLLALLGTGGLLAGCQSAGGEVAVARQSAAVAVAAPAPAVALVPAAHSLAPTPLAPTSLAPLPDVSPELRAAVAELRGRLGPEAAALRPEVLERACVGYLNLRQAGRISRPGMLAIADMDLPSSEPRLWVLDLRAGQVLHRSPVAHGRGSGEGVQARRFSNTIKSACTALGFYRTQDTYRGKHGLSRRLRGLDAGHNDNALRRYVVLHSADYVSTAYMERHGKAGNSRGCPALPPDQYRAIISAVGEGGCLYLSGPGLESKWLDAAGAAQRLAAQGWR
ncbi:murein L,D-transpeptidase catalytic domain family protein [Hymenobacter lapidiphilus]|uniref:Murein L,D-transpeptidase catalytic domain family protein n=1 Tax=Hymenobacter lapidiphilus TaxID=2608003 RepID=A0A7Y7PMU9_9BACT|nr:murein L,D-transpeptidase catalytic domain family protein [Hymenobacter lapidiphilus]NVO30709.1 murein L,D-transpeptidase catalytic domain family protein [Hymenobacter lapidiphilus]